PRLAAGGVPGAELGQAARVPRAHEQDVALTDLHALLARGSFEVLAKDMLAGLEPTHAARSGDVEQHPPPDEAVLDELDRLGRGSAGGDRVGRNAVVEMA